ncbi:sugar ABC transporter substrate-binding protein [Curtobacterium herbarum]|uniref:ABC transporter substrate-binding protein n=1 Tax=Curtobacterium herbarum TaxID=150122 RepID=A0ABP4K9G9_9MICO|nr:extracellular solute-binding protein [Curtobacterium herbarum]MBM7474593.1 multiple sugar transport system substrate-binding protein [Curtobacterium herbarum]MCS6545248.1 extracellular solute-binding protein [Curtobacterium herbarum]
MQRRMPRMLAVGAIALTAALSLTACGGSGFSQPSSSDGKLTSSSSKLNVLIASSGDAEASAVKQAVSSWSEKSGTGASVQVASDLDQQMSQGFASGKPADVFYASSAQMTGWAKNGSLLPYGDQLSNKGDFYPTLKQSFTYDGKFYCAPKDFSTLALFINTADWKAAGLTDSDVPKTWDELSSVAKKLTQDGHVGLAMSPQYERIGAFMAQAGGELTNTDQTKATVDSDANAKAFNYVKGLLKDGSTKFSSDLGEGWGGDAFGKGKSAMTIEGNWLTGAMKSSYPNVGYKVVELPAGPSGAGTLQFTNCWGIAKASKNQAAALKLVEQLTSADQQLTFAKEFGVMPSVQSAASKWKQEYPQYAAFLDEVDSAKGVPNKPGTADVITDFDSKIPALASTDVQTLLEGAQKNLAAALKQ